MWKRTSQIVATAAIFALLAAASAAAPERKRGGAQGKVTAIDTEARTITVETAKDGSVTMKFTPRPQIFRVDKADMDVVKDGAFAEVVGKVNDNDKTIDAKRITVYLPRPRGTGLIIRGRIDGFLKKDGDTLLVVPKIKEDGKMVDKPYEVKMDDKTEVQTRTWGQVADIPVGATGGGGGFIDDDGMIEAYIFMYDAE